MQTCTTSKLLPVALSGSTPRNDDIHRNLDQFVNDNRRFDLYEQKEMSESLVDVDNGEWNSSLFALDTNPLATPKLTLLNE